MSAKKVDKTKKIILENPETGEDMTQEEAIHYQCQDIEEYDRMFAAGLKQTMEEEEEMYAKEHALEYKRENDVLRYQLQEQRKTHEMEIAQIKATYETAIKELRHERNMLAHEPVTTYNVQNQNSNPDELTLTVTEIVDHVKENFSQSGAQEVSTMLFQFVVNHNHLDKGTLKRICDIVPSIINRDRQQNNLGINTVQQLNINPQTVTNNFKEDK